MNEISGRAKGWFGGFREWKRLKDSDGDVASVAVRALVAEMLGAGVVAADSADAQWRGGGSHAGWDVIGDGVKGDAKRAWQHADGVLGFGGPGRTTLKRYDPAKLDEIILVLLDGEPSVVHEYRPDGSVRLKVVARAQAVWRVPVEAMNRLMRRQSSLVRWLITASDIEEYLVRGAWPESDPD